MKKILILILAMVSLSTVHSNINEKAMIEQAQKVLSATISSDYNTLIDYIHPTLQEIVGGRDSLISMTRRAMEELKSNGTTIDSAIVGTPTDTAMSGSDIHCIIPTKTFMTFPDMRLISHSALLCISSDGGENWKFIDLNQFNNSTIQMFFPDFNPKLQIPIFPMPEMIIDKKE